MTDLDLDEVIRTLPAVEEVRTWAHGIVAARGDAFSDWLFKDGLRIESTEVLGADTQIVRENVGNPAQGGTNVATRIELAVYPATTFDPPIWDHPDRTWKDVPYGHGSRRYNTVHHQLTGPTLARVVEMGYGSERVRYTLYEMEPGFQQRVAEANAVRAARGLTPAQEFAAWVRGEL